MLSGRLDAGQIERRQCGRNGGGKRRDSSHTGIGHQGIEPWQRIRLRKRSRKARVGGHRRCCRDRGGNTLTGRVCRSLGRLRRLGGFG